MVVAGHADAEAADALLPLKKKLRALSYGTGGQDPRHLFGQYDRDNSGELCAATIHTIIAVIAIAMTLNAQPALPFLATPCHSLLVLAGWQIWIHCSHDSECAADPAQ